MKKVLFVFSILLLLCLLSTCYYDSEEFLFPDNNNQCDTTNITYTLSVKPILQNNCYSCHSNSTNSLGGGNNLENYNELKIHVDDGHLMGTITHADGYPPMPEGGAPKLEDCKITIIRKWVEAGAPNN